ncbi:NAD(P)-binding protein [Pleurotus eryngii]|uniref:NAD(P)-binding protein n=1 Tax=Pleurotus eryngii TaxID=5323 RepID=A0A9P6D452_PLEER|nr:NAD(P)-binding protein [Pleurotus eryngii]
MAILVIGGTGKTGTRLAQLLMAAGHSVYSPLRGVKFDWLDSSTKDAPSNAAAANNEQIGAVYLVGPPIVDMASVLNPFIDLAIEKGVKRFVMLSAFQVTKGQPPMGVVQEYLDTLKVDYCTLRPSWFRENFFTFDLSFNALTSEKIETRNLLVVGPELLTCEQIAAIFTTVLGRNFLFKRVSQEGMSQHLRHEFHPGVTEMFSALNLIVTTGGEEAIYKLENRYVGTCTLLDFIRANKEAWIR